MKKTYTVKSRIEFSDGTAKRNMIHGVRAEDVEICRQITKNMCSTGGTYSVKVIEK